MSNHESVPTVPSLPRLLGQAGVNNSSAWRAVTGTAEPASSVCPGLPLMQGSLEDPALGLARTQPPGPSPACPGTCWGCSFHHLTLSAVNLFQQQVPPVLPFWQSGTGSVWRRGRLDWLGDICPGHPMHPAPPALDLSRPVLCRSS